MYISSLFTTSKVQKKATKSDNPKSPNKDDEDNDDENNNGTNKNDGKDQASKTAITEKDGPTGEDEEDLLPCGQEYRVRSYSTMSTS